MNHRFSCRKEQDDIETYVVEAVQAPAPIVPQRIGAFSIPLHQLVHDLRDGELRRAGILILGKLPPWRQQAQCDVDED